MSCSTSGQRLLAVPRHLRSKTPLFRRRCSVNVKDAIVLHQPSLYYLRLNVINAGVSRIVIRDATA